TRTDEFSKQSYQAMTEVIGSSPAALIAAVVPVLKDDKPNLRAEAAVLLSRVDANKLASNSYYNVRYNDVRQKSAHNAYERSAVNNVYEDIFDLIAYWQV